MLNIKYLTEMLENLRLENNIAGMSVAVTDGEKVLYNQGFGFENALRPDVPTYPEAMYKIASMTKSVAAVMILRLCEEGILHLDTPIKTYIPWLTLSRPEAAETMTLRHLLTHTSGLPTDAWLPEGSRDEDTIERVARETLPTFPLGSTPGEGKYCYSNWGFSLAGCVASAVTGKTISQLLSEYVLTPLGMDRTTFDYYVASTWPLSLPHTADGEGKFSVIHRQRVNTAYYAGGGLYSNTTDVCKLMRFFLNGGVTDSGKLLLSEASLQDMLSKHVVKDGNPGHYYGLGMFVRPFRDRYIYGHTGNYAPYNSSYFVDMKTGCGVTTMFNTQVSDIRYHIPEMIFEMLD